MSRVATGGQLLLAFASGCASDSSADATADSYIVRDSAGIRIVESVAPAWGAGGGWTIDPSPFLQIGEVEGAEEYQLYDVGGAVRLGDGLLAVATGGNEPVLRMYDGSGAYRRSVGHAGEGPGEFRSIDGLLAGTNEHLSLEEYDASGAVVRSFRVPGLDSAMSQVAMDSLTTWMRESLPGAGDLGPMFDALELPAIRPRFGGIEISADDHVWLPPFTYDLMGGWRSGAPVWTVLDPEGRWLGSVEMPDGLTPTDFGPDWIVGLWEDELGVEYVRVHQIVKGGP